MLGVSPNTLRAWERRFGYPRPERSSGGQRLYSEQEVRALRDALAETGTISRAISSARDEATTARDPVLEAIERYDAAGADAAMEALLAVRQLDVALSEGLLSAVQRVFVEHGATSTTAGFAAFWAIEWLTRARRLFAPKAGSPTILLCVAGSIDPPVVAAHALHLMLLRAGIRVVTVPADRADGVMELLECVHPAGLVLAGELEHETQDRWISHAIEHAPNTALFTYQEQTRSVTIWALEPDPAAAVTAIEAALYRTSVTRRDLMRRSVSE